MVMLQKTNKNNAKDKLEPTEKEKLEEFSSHMFTKYGISKQGPMSDRLIDLVLRVRSLRDK
jgi:hypothetical protein